MCVCIYIHIFIYLFFVPTWISQFRYGGLRVFSFLFFYAATETQEWTWGSGLPVLFGSGGVPRVFPAEGAGSRDPAVAAHLWRINSAADLGRSWSGSWCVAPAPLRCGLPVPRTNPSPVVWWWWLTWVFVSVPRPPCSRSSLSLSFGHRAAEPHLNNHGFFALQASKLYLRLGPKTTRFLTLETE